MPEFEKCSEEMDNAELERQRPILDELRASFLKERERELAAKLILASGQGEDTVVTRDTAEQPPVKSEGQLVLERLLAVRQHMLQVDRQIVAVKTSVGIGSSGGASQEGGSTEVTAFLPALKLLADQMETALTRIEGHVNDLAEAF